jgi:hypothetical protein
MNGRAACGQVARLSLSRTGREKSVDGTRTLPRSNGKQCAAAEHVSGQQRRSA